MDRPSAISLFSGVAGLDLGVREVFPSCRTVAYVEREAYACEVLVSRMEEGALDPAPIWTDVCTFDGRPWRGVDLVVGGFPCQDISNAGKRRGITGARSGLWKHFARIVDECAPGLVFIENVSALRTRGLEVVLSDLSALGFDAEWGCFRASDVGASHRRERLFILAYSRCVSLDRLQFGRGSRTSGQGEADVGSTCANVAYSHGRGLEGLRGRGLFHGERPARRDDPDRRGREDVGHADDPGLEGRELCRGGRAYERVAWPPGPEDFVGWAEFLRRWPGLEPSVRRGAHGLANRVDRLRLCGNGVVPSQAALAFRTLLGRVMESK